MNKLLLFIAVIVSVVSFGQQKTKISDMIIEFDTIVVLQLEPKTDSLVDEWQNANSCKYFIKRKDASLAYEEKNPQNEIVKSWRYAILNNWEDNDTYTFEVDAKDRVIYIVIWKDKSMVALQDVEWNYLISN